MLTFKVHILTPEELLLKRETAPVGNMTYADVCSCASGTAQWGACVARSWSSISAARNCRYSV